MQTINLDLSVRSIIPLLHAKQGDVGRKFKAILTDGGAAYPVPAGAAVSVWYSGASGEGNYTDIGADSAVSVSGNEITVELITQMLANYGAGSVCLVINTADGDQLGTWSIPYMVEPLPGMGSAAAQAYFTAFSQAVQNLPYPDTTLSAPGRAADALAVGTALAGKAPAGYGLGVFSQSLTSADDLNAVKANGWYKWAWNDAPANAPTEAQWSQIGCCRDWTYDGGVSLQEYVDLGWNPNFAGVKVERTIYGDDAQPWGFVNPPMLPDVEYRTTERYNGNPVYTKVINCGSLDVGTWKTHDFTGATGGVIRYSGMCAGTAIPFQPFPVADPNNNITLGVTPATIYISKGTTTTINGDIYVQIWYIK